MLSLVWLGACLWLGREPAAWSKCWVGWWTGDREGARPLWGLKAYLPAGAEVVSAEGDAAFRFGGMAVARLGHWRSRTIPATWAGWVRVTSTNGVWPKDRLWLRQAAAPGSVGLIGLEAGRPWAALDTFSSGNAELRVKADLLAQEPVALGRWVHLAFTTDGVLLRLLVDGVPVAEQRNFRNHGAAFYLAALNLSAGMTGPGNGVVVEQDDVVLFDRVLGYAEQVLPGELAAHEARWSARQGFAYRVHPPAGPEREPVLELEGNPQMPVVLYGPTDLKPDRWLTNHTILGRDLLYRRKDDPRIWGEGRRVEALTARNEISPSGLEVIAPAAWYGKEIEGMRLYAPWTLRTKPNDGTTLESAAWRGAIFASVDVRAALKAHFSEEEPLLGFRYSIGTLGGHAPELLADSGELLPGTADRPEALLRRRLEIPLYHQRLMVDLWTTDAFEAQSMRRWARIAGGAGGAITLLAAALLFVQARARTRQQRVLDALSAANSELLLTYREREEMSRDLHDGSIQNLYALGLHLQRVQLLLGTAPARVSDELKNSLGMLNLSIAELRQFILSAGVDKLDQHTVAAALEGLVGRLRATTLVELQLHAHPDCAALEPSAGVELLHIVREAVSNALRHAAPHRVTIRLEPVARPQSVRAWWRLEVADDGAGFAPEQANGSGRGLKNFTARAAELGGQSRIDSTPGGGTRVTVEFPA